MEEKNTSNLPVEVKQKALLSDHQKLGKTLDALKRAGAIVGSTATMFIGLGMSAVPILPVSVAGYGVFATGVTNFARHASLKTEPTLLFGSRKQSDGIVISQDLLNIGTSTRMAGYDSLEKMSMMGLQTLVGFSRYKQALKDGPYEEGENGQKIYSQNFVTLTHGINLENFKALEALGYIKIDSMSSEFTPKSLSERVARLGKKPGEETRSYLLLEKIGFGNWDGARKAIKAMNSKDDKEKEENSKVMEKVSFRLTDKPIDFDEIQQFRNPKYRQNLPPEMAKAAFKIGRMARLMESRHLSIKQDAFGRDYIKYPSRLENAKINQRKENARREAEEKRKANSAKSKFDSQKKEFNERMTEGVESKGKVIESVEKEMPLVEPQVKTAEEQEL